MKHLTIIFSILIFLVAQAMADEGYLPGKSIKDDSIEFRKLTDACVTDLKDTIEATVGIDYTKRDGSQVPTDTWDFNGEDLSNVGNFDASTVSGDGSGLTDVDADTLDGNNAAHYLDRANHTGTQLSSTVSDFLAEVQSIIDDYSYNSTEIYTKTETDATLEAVSYINPTGGILEINGTLEINDAIGIGITPESALHLNKGFGTASGIQFSDGDTNIYESSDDVIQFKVHDQYPQKWTAGYTQFGSHGGLARIKNAAPTNINPNITPVGDDADTGIGRNAADQLSLVAGGAESLRAKAMGVLILGTLEVTNTCEATIFVGSGAGLTGLPSGKTTAEIETIIDDYSYNSTEVYTKSEIDSIIDTAKEAHRVLYVRKGGNDSGSGSELDPFLTIGHAYDIAETMTPTAIDPVVIDILGKYTEQVTVDVAGIHFYGYGQGVTQWHYAGNALVIEDNGVDPEPWDMKIKGISLQSTDTGEYAVKIQGIAGTSLGGNEIQFMDCRFEGTRSIHSNIVNGIDYQNTYIMGLCLYEQTAGIWYEGSESSGNITNDWDDTGSKPSWGSHYGLNFVQHLPRGSVSLLNEGTLGENYRPRELDDTGTSTAKIWSSDKINSELSGKLDTTGTAADSDKLDGEDGSFYTTASNIDYDNTGTGLVSTNLQDVVGEAMQTVETIISNLELNDLDDVNASAPNDGESLVWKDAPGEWTSEAISMDTSFYRSYYIAPNGNDISGDGSFSNPYATPGKLWNVIGQPTSAAEYQYRFKAIFAPGDYIISVGDIIPYRSIQHIVGGCTFTGNLVWEIAAEYEYGVSSSLFRAVPSFHGEAFGKHNHPAKQTGCIIDGDFTCQIESGKTGSTTHDGIFTNVYITGDMIEGASTGNHIMYLNDCRIAGDVTGTSFYFQELNNFRFMGETFQANYLVQARNCEFSSDEWGANNTVEITCNNFDGTYTLANFINCFFRKTEFNLASPKTVYFDVASYSSYLDGAISIGSALTAVQRISLAVNDLSDTNAGSPADGNVLTWDDGSGKWINEAPNTDADTLDGQDGSWYQDRANHTGTQLAATISDFLAEVQAAIDDYGYNSTEIYTKGETDSAITTGISNADLDDLSDVVVDAPDDNDVLTYDTGTGTWTSETISTDSGPFEISSDVIREKSAEGYNNDFVVCSSSLDYDGSHISRMFFDQSKGAFRAGKTSGTGWNDTNRGNYSAAFGNNGLASGDYSFAIGSNCDATGSKSFAGGDYSDATGQVSFSYGYTAVASGPFDATAIGSNVTARSSNTFALGNSITVGTSDSNAQNSIGIGLDATARTLIQANTMAIMGGNVGIGNLTPSNALDVTGTIEVDNVVCQDTVEANAFKVGHASGYVREESGNLRFSDNYQDFTLDEMATAIDEKTTPAEVESIISAYSYDSTEIYTQTETDNLLDGKLGATATAADSDKLDAQDGSWYQDRANHTGTQLAATVSDFTTAAEAVVDAYGYNSTEVYTKSEQHITYPDVINNWVAAGGLPLSPNLGDRWACLVGGFGWTGGNIYEYNGSTWDETATVTNSQVLFTDDTKGTTEPAVWHQKDNATGFYIVTSPYYYMGLNDLHDVDAGTLPGFDDAILKYDHSASEWTVEVWSGSGTSTSEVETIIDAYSYNSTEVYTKGETDSAITTGISNADLDDLADVVVDAPDDNDVLTYDTSTGTWTSEAAAGGGAFQVSSNLVYPSGDVTLSTDDFVFGSDQLDDDGTNDARFWFNKTKYAFRAGSVTGAEWDDANVGYASFAGGYNCTASATGSFAFGNDSLATDYYAIAMGNGAEATNTDSISLGRDSAASGNYAVAIGQDNIARSTHSMALGYKMTVGTDDTDAQYSMGINLNTNTPLTLTQPNTMAIMGGKVGIADLTPEYELDVTGDINFTGNLREDGNIVSIPTIKAGTTEIICDDMGSGTVSVTFNTSFTSVPAVSVTPGKTEGDSSMSGLYVYDVTASSFTIYGMSNLAYYDTGEVHWMATEPSNP